MTVIEVIDWVHLKSKGGIDYTNIATVTKVTKMMVYVKIENEDPRIKIKYNVYKIV